MAEHELWSFSNALILIILVIIIILIATFGVSKVFDLKKIKANWAEYRCNPTIMPFASVFGQNTNENFEFCLGKIFNTHAQPYMGSMSSMFGGFTGLLSHIFDSISSLRNTIASIGGGINVIFQEFTERISNFFFKLRMSAIRVKMLMGRIYAIMFSVMYMGMSGITGLTSFTNTFLFSFLNVFCFPGDTKLEVLSSNAITSELKEIKDIKIGDILLPNRNCVTATFRFYSKGQPMVKLGDVIVSTNHYVIYKGAQIKADKHPDAIPWGNWESDEPLYCLNTHNHIIPVGGYNFLDYDETPEADTETMDYIQNRVNSTKNIVHKYKFKEYSPGIGEDTPVPTKQGIKLAKDIKIGDKLPTGSEVIGLIRREVSEISHTKDGVKITPSTLIWNKHTNQWIRVGEITKFTKEPIEIISFITIPNSQIELENGLIIRDYMELCSPDSEMCYSKKLESSSTEGI
jgi:hypothetical protein